MKGGILLVIADAANAPIARVLIQPDADILMSINRSCLHDAVLRTRLHDEQQAICARLAAATRPLDAVWTGTHVISAIVYLVVAQQTAAIFEHWVVQTAVSAGIVLLGTLAASLLRRLLLRWFLRHL
jgi:hypothetical protein